MINHDLSIEAVVKRVSVKAFCPPRLKISKQYGSVHGYFHTVFIFPVSVHHRLNVTVSSITVTFYKGLKHFITLNVTVDPTREMNRMRLSA